MAQKVVQVGSYYRKGKLINKKGYERMQDIERGPIGRKQALPRVQHTIYLKSNSGLFKGRKRVEGSGDSTGIIRELSKGRILGRTKKFATV